MNESGNLMMDDTLPSHEEIVFPAGGKIAMGEQATPDGPLLFLSMTAAGASEPSIVFAIDPISKQPLLSLLHGPGDTRVVPLDKLIGAVRNLGTGSLLTGR